MASDARLLPATAKWLAEAGFAIKTETLWVEALTHGSTGEQRNYDRLEFLGDRVLGLSVADWLYHHNAGAEGTLAQRLNALVSGQSCAGVARQIGVAEHVRLGKQARDDGASDSDNVLGDIMEALLGAAFIDMGFDATATLVRRFWADVLTGETGRAKHPKSALQEWAAGNGRKAPAYTITDRAGPDHAMRFTVRVEVHRVGAVEATAGSKREAEAAAAALFMETYG